MSHSAPVKRRPPSRKLAAIGIAVILVVLGAFFALIYWVNIEPEAAPAPTTSLTASPSSSASAVVPSATPRATADPSDDVLSDEDLALIEESIETGNAGDAVDYLANPVRVSFAASDFDQPRTPELAVTDLGEVASGTGWNWQVDPTRVDEYRVGPYGDRFPLSAIVGESAEGYTVSLTVDEAAVTGIFISTSLDDLIATTDGTDTN